MLRSHVVLLTNVGLEHTDVLGDTIPQIAAEKLAVVHTDDTIVVLPDDTLVPLVPRGRIVIGGAREAAEAFVGHPIDAMRSMSRCRDGSSGGRERCVTAPTTAMPSHWLREKLPGADYTICASILADKDVEKMLRGLSAARPTRFVATESSNTRSLPAAALAERARPHFALVEAVADPAAAVRRAHELGEPVLVTGSLYLLADLEAADGRAEAR